MPQRNPPPNGHVPYLGAEAAKPQPTEIRRNTISVPATLDISAPAALELETQLHDRVFCRRLAPPAMVRFFSYL